MPFRFKKYFIQFILHVDGWPAAGAVAVTHRNLENISTLFIYS